MKDNKPKSKNKPTAALVAAMLFILLPFAKVNEGFRAIPYKDYGGVWTWCYGDTQGPIPKETLTDQKCSVKLKLRLYVTGMAVWWLVDTQMTPHRWVGLTSFTDNVGINAFRNSTLRRKINAGDPKACDQLMRWTYVGKTDCSIPANGCMGLSKRRTEEKKLCNS